MKKILLLCMTIVMVTQSVYSIVLHGKNIPKDKFILFIFIGQSNMMGYGGVPDKTPHPRVFMYTPENGFYNAVDPIQPSMNSPSPPLPFLKQMAEYYPDYYFCGIKACQAGKLMVSHFTDGTPQYNKIMASVNAIKNDVTVGGILAMFGFVEGISDKYSQSFCADVMSILTTFREKLALTNLPLIFGKYEVNCGNEYPDYLKFKDRMIQNIQHLPLDDPHKLTALTPYEPIPKEMYFDDHHYNDKGYTIWSQNAAEIIKNNRWDFWYKNPNKPLILTYPKGNEQFNPKDTLSIMWNFDSTLVSTVFLSISIDSGKQWHKISGDFCIDVELGTFKWVPSDCAINVINKQILLRITSYSLIYSDQTKAFTISKNVAIHTSNTMKRRGFSWHQTGRNLQLTLNANKKGGTITLYTIKGSRLLSHILADNQSKHTISLQGIPAGMYWVRLQERFNHPYSQMISIIK